MHIYTYPSYHSNTASGLSDYQSCPIHVWFDEKTQVYRANLEYNGSLHALSQPLGEKNFEELKKAVEWNGGLWNGPLPDDIFDSLAKDSKDLRARQAKDRPITQVSPQVLQAAISEENTYKSQCLYETENAQCNIEVNFDIATGMFNVKGTYKYNSDDGIDPQKTPKFGTSSVQEVRDILSPHGKIPPEIDEWIGSMSKKYPRFEKREDPEAERYRVIDITLEFHQRWLEEKEGGRQASFVDIDISGDHFRGRDLEKMDFTRCDMRRITDIQQLDFSRTIMPNTNWQGLDISGMRFELVDLSGANFKYTKISNVWFSGDIAGSSFDGSEISESRFWKTEMHGTTLRNAKVNDTWFSDIPSGEFALSGTKLRNCRIENSDISQWDLTRTRIQAIIDLPSFTTLNKNDDVTNLDLSFHAGEISARNATIIAISMGYPEINGYVIFLPDRDAFIGSTGFESDFDPFIKEMGYSEEYPSNKVKIMTSVEEVAGIFQEYIEIPIHLQVKMQRLLDENTKRLASNNTSKEPEHAEENSQGR